MKNRHQSYRARGDRYNASSGPGYREPDDRETLPTRREPSREWDDSALHERNREEYERSDAPGSYAASQYPNLGREQQSSREFGSQGEDSFDRDGRGDRYGRGLRYDANEMNYGDRSARLESQDRDFGREGRQYSQQFGRQDRQAGQGERSFRNTWNGYEASDSTPSPYARAWGSSHSSQGSRASGNYGRQESRDPISGSSFAGKGPKGYRRSDERIKDEVCDALEASPQVDASEIEVDVKGGEVTLTGTVTERHMKRAAEESIEHLAGVTDIHNQIRVVKSASQAVSSRASSSSEDLSSSSMTTQNAPATAASSKEAKGSAEAFTGSGKTGATASRPSTPSTGAKTH